MKVEKKSYTTPKLTVHGDVEAITQATNVGTVLDGTYGAGTAVDGSSAVLTSPVS